ncbi:MAG: flagellin [bacterium]|nr:flagellin [bacterium]
MSLRLNTNVAALKAHLNLETNSNALNRSLERLSSGLRINRSADDAAGLAISERMGTQIRGLEVASRNAMDGISMVQTADGALGEASTLILRMRELAVQAASDSQTMQDRQAIQREIDQLILEVDRIAQTTEFNRTNLLDGSRSVLTLQIGANEKQFVEVALHTASAAALVLTSLPVTDSVIASTSVARIDAALERVLDQRASMGAMLNRLDLVMNNLTTQSEKLTASRSRIRDLDMATEVVELSRSQILNQTSVSMLSQANQAPQAVLALIRGG